MKYYRISVDYSKSVEELVELGCYEWADDQITTQNFPSQRDGTAEIDLALIHFGKFVDDEEALRRLGKMSYRPADLHELLYFSWKYPDAQREFPVVALGSSAIVNQLTMHSSLLGHRWTADKQCSFPGTYRGNSEHKLHLGLFTSGWPGIYRFAAVRKLEERR